MVVTENLPGGIFVSNRSKSDRQRSSLIAPFILSLTIVAMFGAISAHAGEPTGELAKQLARVKFELYAKAPGYSEGPTWRRGELFFCSGALLRVDAQRKVHKYLDIDPAGTVLRRDGHLLICDNKNRALLDVSPEGKVGVVVEQFGTE